MDNSYYRMKCTSIILYVLHSSTKCQNYAKHCVQKHWYLLGVKLVCTGEDELKPRNMDIEETLKKQELVNDILSKSVQVIGKSKRKGKLQISQLTKNMEDYAWATKELANDLSSSNLQNNQLKQKLKETEKAKSKDEEQVTTSNSRIEVLLEDLNVTKTETAQVIESKSQEIDTLLEKREEYDGVLAVVQSKLPESNA